MLSLIRVATIRAGRCRFLSTTSPSDDGIYYGRIKRYGESSGTITLRDTKGEIPVVRDELVCTHPLSELPIQFPRLYKGLAVRFELTLNGTKLVPSNVRLANGERFRH